MLLLSLTLIAINTVSFFWIPLKHPAAINTLSYKEANHLLQIYFNEARSPYDKALYATHIFHQAIKIYWPEPGESDKLLKVPFLFNWVLFTVNNVFPLFHLSIGFLNTYEFSNYKFTIARGVGVCSQFSLAIADFMQKQGYAARAMGSQHHTIVEVDLNNGHKLIMDGMFNVVLPYGISYAKTHASETLNNYKKQDPNLSKELSLALIDIYTNGNFYYYHSRFIVFAALLQWTIPLFILLISIFL